MVVVHQLKGKKVLSYLKSRSADIAFLQETHFENGTEALKMKRDWVGKVFHNLGIRIRKSTVYHCESLKILKDE